VSWEVTDPDGNIIRQGMLVVSGGETWVVGAVTPYLIRLDQPGVSRLLGRARFRLCHVIGFQHPTIYQ
jgi:hypothetical protein